MKGEFIDKIMTKFERRITIHSILNYFFQFWYVFQVGPKWVARGEELKSGMFSKTVTKTDQMYLWTLDFGETLWNA